MARRTDTAKIVGETLAGLLSTAGAAAATAIGAPILAVGLGKGVWDGISKYLLARLPQSADTEQLLSRIRDERTAATVETIREALVAASGLAPEFQEPIDALADAVSGGDDQRFQHALLSLFSSVTQVTASLDDIKADTTAIRDDTMSMRADIDAIRSAVIPKHSSDTDSASIRSYLGLRIESLSTELRQHLDAKGQQMWQDLHDALAERSWHRVLAQSEDLEAWLDTEGDKISPDIKGQALLTLADVTLIRDSGIPYEASGDTAEAWRLLERAESVLGSTPSAENADRLIRVRAKLMFVDGDHSEAVECLDKTHGAGTTSLKLAFLLEQGRWDVASELAAQEVALASKWADDAIVAHMRAGRRDRAEATLTWARSEDALTLKRCVLVFAQVEYNLATKDGTHRSIRALEEYDREHVLAAKEDLSQCFASVLEAGPQCGLDAEALELLILFGHVLRDRASCQRAADQLAMWSPASPELGRAALRRDIAPIDGLADRYLREHPGVFLFELIAAMMQIELEGGAAAALDRLLTLIVETESGTQREELATSIMVAVQHCDDAKWEDALSTLDRVLGREHRIPGMVRIARLLNEEDLLKAGAELDRIKDESDYLWLQLAAAVAFKAEDWKTAAERARQFGDLTGHANAYVREAEAWHRAGDYRTERITALETAIALAPSDNDIRQQLAAAYHSADRYPDASAQYAVLWAAGPRSDALTLNYASCLALTGDVAAALACLGSRIDADANDATVELLLMRSQLMHSQGRPRDALDSLLPYKERLGRDHRFLMELMQLGYASDCEKEAQSAFAALVGLLDEGVLPEGVLVRYSIDDMLSMHQQWRDRKSKVNQQYLTGRLPWLLASRWVAPSQHVFLSWLTRTQPLILSDHPDNLAEFTIYCSNGFTSVDEEGERHLVRIEPPQGDTIVADISSLVTIQRLGLFDALGAAFGTVLVPQSYQPAWIEEHRRIAHHQPSQIAMREKIVDAARAGRLEVVSTTESDAIPVVLDEYVEEAPAGTSAVIRIAQFARCLASAGRLSAQRLNEIESRATHPDLVSDEQAQSALSEHRILARAFTLQTVAGYGLLDEFIDESRMSIAEAELVELESELRGQRFADEAGEWHRSLVDAVQNSATFEFAPLATQDDEDDADQADSSIHYGLDAVLLANERDLPLLADDRRCQQMRLNHNNCGADQAFGTDILIERLMDDGQLTIEEATDHVAQMMQWRYRFMLPPCQVLVEMASRFKTALPGSQLRTVASYVQDCVRDAGLYGGPEKVEPPIPMAMRLFTAWTTRVAEFIVHLWCDSRFSELQAATLTRWVVRNLVPVWPKNLPAPSWRHVADAGNSIVLSSVLMQLLSISDAQKANRIFSRVRRSLATDDETLAEVVETAASALADSCSSAGESAVAAAVVHVLQIAYGTKRAVNWRLLPVAEMAGLVDSDQPQDEVPPEYIEVITNPDHSARLSPTTGPFVYSRVQGESSASASFMPDMLCAAKGPLRIAALDQLLSPERCPTTEQTRGALRTQADGIRAVSAREWVPAVAQIHDIVHEDFHLNAAGFEQAQARRHDDGGADCWRRLIRPTAESLLALDDGWRFTQLGPASCDSCAMAIEQAASLQALLSAYEQHLGHLTLAPPLDLGTLVASHLSRNRDADLMADLTPWLESRSKPWRRYHACQALLRNANRITPSDQTTLWERVIEIAELCLPDGIESDAAQVWRMEQELAGHYLRVVDLSGYSLEENRPLTVAWRAALRVTELLTTTLEADEIPAQLREWRNSGAFRAVRVVHDAWAWLCPKPFTPGRFAALNCPIARGMAILFEIGDFARDRGIESIPTEFVDRLGTCFVAAVFVTAGTSRPRDRNLWVWDRPLVASAESFLAATPTTRGDGQLSQSLELVRQLGTTEAVREALQKLTAATAMEAVFVCNRIRQYCYEDGGAADVLIAQLRNVEWRDACAANVPRTGWELIAQGLLFLQHRQGLEWSVELPYVFLRLAEASCRDQEKADLFVACLIMSSVTGGTAGALKLLAKSRSQPELRPVLEAARDRLDLLRSVCEPSVPFRLRGVLAVLEDVLG